MRKLYRHLSKRCVIVRCVAISLIGLALASPALAQANSPWENAVNVLQQAFTSTIARGLSLVAIVVSGLTFAFGEGGSKRVLAGVLFGVGMAISVKRGDTGGKRRDLHAKNQSRPAVTLPPAYHPGGGTEIVFLRDVPW